LISRLSGGKFVDYLGQGLVFSIYFDKHFLEVASLLQVGFFKAWAEKLIQKGEAGFLNKPPAP